MKLQDKKMGKTTHLYFSPKRTTFPGSIAPVLADILPNKRMDQQLARLSNAFGKTF